MLTIKEAEEILKKEYDIDNFSYLISDILLPDFSDDKHDVSFKNQIFSSVKMLGYSLKCEVTVFEVYLNEGTQNRRVAITQEMFRVLRGLHINNAIVAFVNADKRNYRISLLTSKYEFDGDKIVKILSNPRRLSYALGYGTKTKTAYKFLIEKGIANSLDELIGRFSLEVVNKQFYAEIATSFTELVGGERNGRKYDRKLNLYGVVDQNKYAEFGVRLIGRIMFCWFLREKRSEKGIPLVPDDMLSIDTIQNGEYYHKVLEPLFFELLNTNQNRRKKEFQDDYYGKVPYLNGGLFSPQSDDHYKYDSVTHSGVLGLVTIPDQWFVRLYSILGEYNFTVDENTAYDIELSIDPEMLGRIFENLLAEINPETGENAKKSTGSFYTPRDIVDYMVDSSLCEYLKTKTDIAEDKLCALISYFREDDEENTFSKQDKKQIIDALYTITTLDPACGSGAFPIGMLQKIVYILQVLDPGADLWFDKATENVGILLKKEFEKKFNSGSLNYIRKLSVIQNSIFGIDIQPIAVEISRLRCFLSLIIEEKVDDAEENRGINALPNLDFKFIIANSLISLDNDDQFEMLEDISHIEQLKAVREEYFNAESDRRTELKLDFSQIQQEMCLNAIEHYAKQASQKYTQLFSWKPFSNEATGWFDPDWMFGIKDGFDVVIGNPPYIQLQKSIDEKSNTKLGDFYQNQLFATFAKTGDIYCLFYEKGIKLLRNKGIITYITSNKWMRAGYGEKLRLFLSNNTNPLLLIDFAGAKVFESATVDVNILIAEKANNSGKTKSVIANDESRNNLSVFVEQKNIVSSFYTSNNWTIMSSIEQSILKKMESLGIPLKKWDIQINRGILTGFNDAFIISSEKKDELISEDPKSADIIRPILRGRDIKRYSYSFADLWIIALFPSCHYNIDCYPAIKNHLLSYGIERLEQTGRKYLINGLEVRARKKTNNKWYETQDSIQYWNDFNKQKIVYREISEKMDACLVEEGFMLNNKCYLITGNHLIYILSYLNSKLFTKIILPQANITGGKGEAFLSEISLLPPSDDVEKRFEQLYKLRNKGYNVEKEIEELFGLLYKLTDEEIEFIVN